MGDVYKNRRQILNQDVQNLQNEYLTFVNKIEQIEHIERKFGPVVTKKRSGVSFPEILSPKTTPRESSNPKDRNPVISQNTLRSTF